MNYHFQNAAAQLGYALSSVREAEAQASFGCAGEEVKPVEREAFERITKLRVELAIAMAVATEVAR